MATIQEARLRTPEPQLVRSRQQFIQTLDNKREFEAECVVIIPVLDAKWKEKILPLLGYRIPTDMQPYKSPGFTSVDETHCVNFRHYLYNYSPQLLVKAINRVAARLEQDKLDNMEADRWGGSAKPPRTGEIQNVSAYFKSIVQDLRRKEQKKEAQENRLSAQEFLDTVWDFGVNGGREVSRLWPKIKEAIAFAEAYVKYLQKQDNGYMKHVMDKTDEILEEITTDIDKILKSTKPVRKQKTKLSSCKNKLCRMVRGKIEHHLHCPERGPGWA